jgi:hypothetical protein
MTRLILAAVLGLSLMGLVQTSALAQSSENGGFTGTNGRAVPEPASALAAVAVLGFAWALRKRVP